MNIILRNWPAEMQGMTSPKSVGQGDRLEIQVGINVAS